MGRYLAILLAKDGADVVVCDVNEDTLNKTLKMLATIQCTRFHLMC